jgi:hypothetical protein
VVDDLAMGPTDADVIVTGGADVALVLKRSFDSRWRWVPRGHSRLLDLSEHTWAAVGGLQAEALRRATRADFALISAVGTPQGTLAFTPGLTRASDVTPYFAPLSTMQLTGRELLAAHQVFSNADGAANGYVVGFSPRFEPNEIEPARTYSVASRPRVSTSSPI